jgi:hypothetical protein
VMSADSASTISSLCPPGVTDHDPSSCAQTVRTIVPAVAARGRSNPSATMSRVRDALARDRPTFVDGRTRDARGGDRRVATRRERDADGGLIRIRSIDRFID